MRKVDVTADAVRQGDVLDVGGLLHEVSGVRDLHGRRRRLEFADGSVYVLGPGLLITVARAYEGRGAVPHSHPGSGNPPTGDTALQGDFG